MQEIEEKIISILKTIYDPEIPIDIYSMGLIYNIDLKLIDNKISSVIDMTLTSPACPVAGDLVKEVEDKIREIDKISKSKVKLTFTPPWTTDMMSEEGKEIMDMEGAQIK